MSLAGRTEDHVIVTTGFTLVLAMLACGCDKNPIGPTGSAGSKSAASAPSPSSAVKLAVPFAFESGRDIFGGIYIADGESGTIERLTTGSNPDWSRDGRIAYYSRGGGKRTGIFVMDATGANDRYVGDGYYASWSSDNRHIATDNEGKIYVLDVDGSEPPRLVAQAPAGWLYANDPAWSPDGKAIAFTVCKDDNDKWDPGVTCGPIHVVAADGSSPPAALGTSSGAIAPAWSPDGSALAYQVAGSIYVLQNGGSTLAASGMLPAWTPDGRLVFTGMDSRLYIADHGAVRRIVPDVSDVPAAARYYQDVHITVKR
jgi:Tol biopolymer transport system component